MEGTGMNINLHIERLVLDGIPLASGQQPKLQSVVEAELTRLVNSGGLSTGLMKGGALAHLSVGTIHLSGESSPNNLGQGIATAVYEGIGQ